MMKINEPRSTYIKRDKRGKEYKKSPQRETIQGRPLHPPQAQSLAEIEPQQTPSYQTSYCSMKTPSRNMQDFHPSRTCKANPFTVSSVLLRSTQIYASSSRRTVKDTSRQFRHERTPAPLHPDYRNLAVAAEFSLLPFFSPKCPHTHTLAVSGLFTSTVPYLVTT
jgi:hypothetical protein